ncbi:spore cortex biosynthesis protein YabQ [Fictibacillus phosphorivorans]|uniref:spore cortex biosynthesis protein YabQ n=1 Tax=Fictibacillus phosphorivorans TaxID=1221500 RepID=UPI00203AAF67|nr:spore cortex biosynthesis protein YabQ [Fictibacillus phosphorivorans]MCM3719868.1 spore cortex biosynthesis protein YabQ [Fictibacillus phosphorivorans]MCM3777558.1 spore cortex biosynthesis protein YabQ [Fictibacillus phosphorivorans]
MTLTVQFQTMLAMVFMGIWIGMAVDTYSRFIHEKRKWHWLHFLNDLLFWLVQALLVFYVLLHVNHAEIRFYIFIALICGYAAYRALFEKIYIKLLEWFVSAVTAIFRFLYNLFNRLLVMPIKWLVMLIMGIVLYVLKLLQRIVVILLKILFSPFKWFGSLVWRFIPKQKWYNLKEKYLKVAGFFKSVKNKVSNWKGKKK